MLGELMGRGLFRSFLTEFSMLFADRPVSTRALMELASDVNGDDLGYFFSQWLDEADVPEFDRTYTMLRLSTGGYKIQGEVTQDLDLFSMPVEIEVLTDGEPEYTTVFLAGPSSDIDILTERRPRSVVIDPRMKVLRMSPDIQVAVHISRGEDLVEAGELAAAIREYQNAIDLDRLSSLAFFRMGEALFEQQSFSFAADVFREALNGDLDPTWIEVWSYINLGKIYDLRIQRDRALIEYNKALSTGDDAYGAQAEAERHIERPFRAN
jgi:tetratricopeptide (TPR) repeat protein